MADRPIRALVVEDTDNWRAYLCLELKRLGCDVVAACNLEEGRAALKSRFDIAIVDVRLVERDRKDLSGLTIVREAWNRRKVAQIIILSGYLTKAQIQRELGPAIPCFVFDKGEGLTNSLEPFLERLVGTARAGEAPHDEASPGAGHEEPQVPGLRALVVEDTESWSELYRVALERQGFVVRTARAYADAVGLTRREHFDLAVADLELAPGSEAQCEAGPQNLHGILLIEWFLERDVPFIIVTGHARPGVVDPIYREFPVFQIMDKASFTLDQFEAYVQEVCNRPPHPGRHTPQDQTRRRRTFDALVQGALDACSDAPQTTGKLQQIARQHRLTIEIDNLVEELGLDQPAAPPASIAAIRTLLLNALTAKDLRRLCKDDEALRPVIDRLSPNASPIEVVDEVLDYCEKQQLWDELWAAVAEANPRRVRQFAERIRAAH